MEKYKPNKKDLEIKIAELETKLSRLATALESKPKPAMYRGFGNPSIPTTSDEMKKIEQLKLYEQEYLSKIDNEARLMNESFYGHRTRTLPKGFGSGGSKPKENKSLTRRFVENHSTYLKNKEPSFIEKLLLCFGFAKVNKTKTTKSKGFGSGKLKRGTLPKGF